MEKTLNIYGKEYVSKSGQKFVAYSYTKDGKKFYRIKFRRDCNSIPNLKGYISLVVDSDYVSIQRAEKGSKLNDILWIGKVLNYAINETKNEERSERLKKEIEDLL